MVKTIDYVQVYGVRRDAVIFTSEVRKRSGCSYEYWATDAFSCSADAVYTIGVFGTDVNGGKIVRHLSYQCATTRPPFPRKLKFFDFGLFDSFYTPFENCV